MNCTVIRTDRIEPESVTVELFVDTYVPHLVEKSIVVVSAKIIALCQGRIIPVDSGDEALIGEAQLYLPRSASKYGQLLTIAQHTLLVSSGVDNSNVSAQQIALPTAAFEVAQNIRIQLQRKYGIEDVAVIIADSASRPLRIGTLGTCIASAGLQPVKDYRGTSDIFGQKLQFTRANHAEAIAAIAVAMMGEGDEQTPICLIEDASFVEFSNQEVPNQLPVDQVLSTDLFAPLLQNVDWLRGGSYDS